MTYFSVDDSQNEVGVGEQKAVSGVPGDLLAAYVQQTMAEASTEKKSAGRTKRSPIFFGRRYSEGARDPRLVGELQLPNVYYEGKCMHR